MATYFHGSSEIQAAAPSDGIQTLYLMTPNYLSSYSSDTSQHHQQQQSPNMLFFNPTAAAGSNSLTAANLSHAPPSDLHPVCIPLPGPASNITPTNPDNNSRLQPLHGVVPGIQYNLWGSIDQNPVVSVAATNDSDGVHDVVSSQMGFRWPMVVSPASQGLSLTLSSQQAQASAAYRPISNEHEIQSMHGHVSAISSSDDIRVSRNSPSSVSAVSNGVSGMQSAVRGSKYLRAVQELLDEVVNVGKGIKSDLPEGPKEKVKKDKEPKKADGFSSGGAAGGESSVKRGAELTAAQRQELQMKKAKLVNMLDEVEQRYRQYHHQMQAVVSAFEQAAGFAAAKSYTALALQTISKQFRCLKDVILSQIKATGKSLGEDDCLGAKVEGSRLRYVDHQLRQQRALQQLGMIQHNNAWRPQRGLPERAVSVLRAWLFEHFLHPYPKDSDKQILAKQTGLTRSQVSNWFINARVRLWKPMVEEMYLEEMKQQEKNGSEGNTSKNENKELGSNSSAPGDKSSTFQIDQLALLSKPEKPTNQNRSPAEFSNFTISMSPSGSIQPQAGFTLIGSPEMEGIAQRSPKKRMNIQNSRSNILSMDMDMKQRETTREISASLGGDRLGKDGYPLITSTTPHDGGFGPYDPMGEFGRYNPDPLTPRFNGNGVSLTLGLPHRENLSLSGAQQNYLSTQSIQSLGRRFEMGSGEADFCGINTSQSSHSTTTTGFEHIDIQNRKRFATQLLPDFVA